MAFVFDSTIGGSSANSYISLADAEDYFNSRLNTDEWDNLDNSDKEAVLVQATRRIDQERFHGIKSETTQALQFPLDGIFDKFGFSIPTNIIPVELKNAVAEFALFFLKEDHRFISETELHDASSLKSHSIAGTLNYEFAPRVKADQLPQIVKNFLSGIGIAWVGKNNVENTFR